MVAAVKHVNWSRDLAHGLHSLNADQLKICLTNVAPDPAADTVFGDLTEIVAGNGYVASGTVAPVAFSNLVGGGGADQNDYELRINPVTVATAVGGSIGPWRYMVLYNTTGTQPIIQHWDKGQSVTTLDGDEIVFDPEDGDEAVLRIPYAA